MKKTFVWALVIIILAIALFFILKPLFTGKIVEENYSEIDKFAQCLSDAGLVMYGTSWCSHCQNQKKLFGKSFKYITYVDCDRNSKVCSSERITGYPTWKINGENYPGEKSFQGLSQLTGCKLNQE